MADSPQDQLWVMNPTDDEFSVKWSGNNYTVQAHQKIIWPRFLAEHFAKKLADKILMEKEEAHWQAYKKSGQPKSEYMAPSYLNSKRERPPVVESILLGVYTYFQGNKAGDQYAEVQRQIDAMNAPQEKVIDMGSQVDPLMGVLKDDDPDVSKIPPADDMPTVTVTPPAPNPVSTASAIPPNETGLQRHHRLMREAKQLGVNVNPSMSNEDLEAAIEQQYA